MARRTLWQDKAGQRARGLAVRNLRQVQLVNIRTRPALDCIRPAHERAAHGDKTANVPPNLWNAMRGCLHGRTTHVH
eukprot:1371703-Lingulodinium_polyedra.AAC.1